MNLKDIFLLKKKKKKKNWAFWFVKGAPVATPSKKNPLNQHLNTHIKALVICRYVKILIIGVLAILKDNFHLFT